MIFSRLGGQRTRDEAAIVSRRKRSPQLVLQRLGGLLTCSRVTGRASPSWLPLLRISGHGPPVERRRVKMWRRVGHVRRGGTRLADRTAWIATIAASDLRVPIVPSRDLREGHPCGRACEGGSGAPATGQADAGLARLARGDEPRRRRLEPTRSFSSTPRVPGCDDYRLLDVDDPGETQTEHSLSINVSSVISRPGKCRAESSVVGEIAMASTSSGDRGTSLELHGPRPRRGIDGHALASTSNAPGDRVPVGRERPRGRSSFRVEQIRDRVRVLLAERLPPWSKTWIG